MVLPSSGTISLGQIATEYSDSQPNSMNEFYRGGDNVPTTVSASATQAAPSSDGTYNNFASVTGLDLVRAVVTVNVDTVTSWSVASDSSKTFTGTGIIVGFTSNSSTTRLDGVRIDEGGVTQLIAAQKSSVHVQNIQSNNTNSGNITRRTTSTSTNYTFTNNTGYSVTIESTTIANGASANVSPSGDFNISYTISANANVPTSGTIDFADFYGGRAS